MFWQTDVLWLQAKNAKKVFILQKQSNFCRCVLNSERSPVLKKNYTLQLIRVNPFSVVFYHI